MKQLLKKYSLFARALLFVSILVLLKFVAHIYDWESLSLNPLFSGIVAANVFLMGFLLGGVLSDYKESEKLPGELAVSLEALLDEASIITKAEKPLPSKEYMESLQGLALAIRQWFWRKEKTTSVMLRLTALNDFFSAFEGGVQANFIARMKQEQSNIRRILVRIHTIRETSFISSGYIIAEVTTCLLCLGLVLSKIDPFYESLFFVSVISFLMIFMLALIKELDNPFAYYENDCRDLVSLQPLQDLLRRRVDPLESMGLEHSTWEA